MSLLPLAGPCCLHHKAVHIPRFSAARCLDQRIFQRNPLCRNTPLAVRQLQRQHAQPPCRKQLVCRAAGKDLAEPSSEEGSWESWADSPDTPLINSSTLPELKPSILEEKLGYDPNWHEELKGLAAELRGKSSTRGSETYEDTYDPSVVDQPERAFLVGVQRKGSRGKKYGYSLDESMDELGRLASTAGLEVVGRTCQQLDEVSPRTYIGSGKVAELVESMEAAFADTVIFDDELTPGQLRNLERALGDKIRLCDRTALILDIFSQRAATREGQLQVDLAAAEYQLPRLTRMWSHLERQAGGQVKGMGEKQIEVDKRILRTRMAVMRTQLDEVRMQRKQYRDRRAKAALPVVALVGYTNAGKSTLINRLTDAGVLAEDKLFATLDPTTRRCALPTGKEVLVTDTVGFIQKLPTQLVAAFRATLEEIADAALLIHVVDVSHPNAAAQAAAVMAVLTDLKVDHVPVLTVWNKVDACTDPDAVREVAARRGGTVAISAATGEGIDRLLGALDLRIQELMVAVHVLIPYSQGELLGEIHKQGSVESEEFVEEGTLLEAFVPAPLASRLSSLAVPALT